MTNKQIIYFIAQKCFSMNSISHLKGVEHLLWKILYIASFVTANVQIIVWWKMPLSPDRRAAKVM